MISAIDPDLVRSGIKSRIRAPNQKPLVNSCLENQTDDEGRSVRNAPTAQPEIHAPRSDTSAAPDSTPEAPGSASADRGRILLLDDDPALREIIRDFLTENGYTVVAVQNGGEGVREVLGSDFALVLCDFIMPGLTGDMFFRAVERIRPALCQRFVFMTGHRNDATTQAFINKVNCLVLQKPFPMQMLLDSIVFAEVRTSYESVIHGPAITPGSAPVPPPATHRPTLQPPVSQEAAVARILARSQAAQAAASPPAAVQETELQPAKGGGFRTFLLAASVLTLALVGSLWVAHLKAQDQLDAVSAKREMIEKDWTAIEPDLHKALATKANAEAAADELARLSAERMTPSWAPLLRCLVPPGDALIEIVGVEARVGKGDNGACEMRIRGTAGGEDAALMAGRFRRSMEESMKKNANGRPVTTRFEPGREISGVPQKAEQTQFVIIATLGSVDPAVAMSKEGR